MGQHLPSLMIILCIKVSFHREKTLKITLLMSNLADIGFEVLDVMAPKYILALSSTVLLHHKELAFE